MNFSFTFFFAFIINYSAIAQLANGNFEEWQTSELGEVPLGWNTNGTAAQPTVLKINSVIEGNWAAQIISNGLSFEGSAPGTLSTELNNVSNNLDSLIFFARCDSIISGGFCALVIMNPTTTDTLLEWRTDSISTEYERIAIPTNFDDINQNILLELVAGTTLTPLGYEGYARFEVDDLRFKLTTSTIESELSDIITFPNPANSILNISGLDRKVVEQIEIYNAQGQLKLTQDNYSISESIDISHLPNGIYYVVIQNVNQAAIQSFIKQ